MTNEHISCIFLCDVFYTIQTFEPDKLTAPIKESLVISSLVGDLYLADHSVYLYNKFSDTTPTIVLSTISHPNIELSFMESILELNA